MSYFIIIGHERTLFYFIYISCLFYLPNEPFLSEKQFFSLPNKLLCTQSKKCFQTKTVYVIYQMTFVVLSENTVDSQIVILYVNVFKFIKVYFSQKETLEVYCSLVQI